MKFKQLAIVIAVLAGFAVVMTGCVFKVQLLPVTINVPINKALRFGPGQGLPPGQELDSYTLLDGLTCNLPSADALIQQARDQAGLAGKLLTIESVNLDKITLTATQGDFKTLTGITLSFVELGVPDAVPIPAASVTSPDGWLFKIELTPGGPLDIYPLLDLQAPQCGAAICSISGTTPDTDIVMNVDVTATAQISVGL